MPLNAAQVVDHLKNLRSLTADDNGAHCGYPDGFPRIILSTDRTTIRLRPSCISDHDDEEMRQQVAEGHRKEFAAFGFGDDVPDPEDPSSYEDFKLKCEEIENGKHAEMLACKALEDRQVALRGRDGKDGD